MEKKLEQRKDMGSGASERHYYELGEVRDAIARQAKSRWWRKNWNSWKPLNFMQRAVELEQLEALELHAKSS